MNLDKDLYTVSEVAALFGVTKPTVYEWMKNRGLVWIWLGGRRRVTQQALRDFLKTGSDASASEGYNPKDIRTPISARLRTSAG